MTIHFLIGKLYWNASPHDSWQTLHNMGMAITCLSHTYFSWKGVFEQVFYLSDRIKLVNTAPSIDNVCTNTFLTCSSLYVDIHQVHNVHTHAHTANIVTTAMLL